MFIVKYRKIWYIFSTLVIIASIFSIVKFGLNAGIDFTGGSLLEVRYEARPSIEDLRTFVKNTDFKGVVLQTTGENGLIVRSRDLTEDEHHSLVALLKSNDTLTLEEERFVSIGPVVGKELAEKSLAAIVLVVIMIILYVAFAFRKISKVKHGISPFVFGFLAVTALMHDIIIPTGVFACLGKTAGVEIDVLFITALLAILGFSVNDTIVVFDRVRENLRKNVGSDFEDTVSVSVKESIARSINTSLTTIVTLVLLFIMGGESTKYLSLALIIGLSVGTYSSLFLASPLLVTVKSFQDKK